MMTTPRPSRPAWQAMDSGELLLVAVAAILVVAAVAQTAASGFAQPRIALAFGGLIALGELLRLELPGARQAAPIASAGAIAYAMLLRVGAVPALHPPLHVIAVAAAGMTVGALPHVAAGRPAGLAGMASRLVAVACVALLFRPLAGLDVVARHWWAALAVMGALVALGWLVKCLIEALLRADALRVRFGVALSDEMRAQLPLGVAIGASSMLVAFAAEVMGLAALAVFIVPLLVTQLAFRRYAGIRDTYLQTVRALARVTEVGGYVESGHARRVGGLAVAVGRELGMREPDLLELEYAALMHDIGQLSLREPIPGGATVLVSPADQCRIAELGAGVIEQAGVLDGVADLVRRQYQPWRATGVSAGARSADRSAAGAPAPSDAAPPVGSRIIRAANAFDDLVGASSDRDRTMAALERLRLDTASEYDPAVVEALSRVAARRRSARR